MPELLAGVPVYPCNAIPAHSQSYVQLKRAGLRPARFDRPDGVYIRGKDQIWLYDQSQAKPYVCTTKRAATSRAIIETTRQRYTCTGCQLFLNDWRWFHQIKAGAGRCLSCQSAGSTEQ